MTPEEALEIAKKIFKIRQKHTRAGDVDIALFKNGRKNKIPEYYQGYVEAVENYHRIRAHAKKGVFPDHLFLEAAPNQDKEEFEYSKKNYKQTTLPVFTDFLNTITRAYTDPSAGVEFEKQEEGDNLEVYVDQEIPTFGSLAAFVKTALPSIKIQDSEGVLAIKPIDVAVEETPDGPVIANERPNPVPVYYSTPQLVGFKEEKFAVIELNERSLVSYGGKKEKRGIIYEVYDEDTIYRIEQVGKAVDSDFELFVYYQHNMGYLPVTKLMGIPIVEETKISWQSPFLMATDLLDLVALNTNYLQHSCNNVAFPYRVMLGNPCEFEDDDGNRCNDGFLDIPLGDGFQKKECPACNGTGLKSRVTRTGQMLIKPASRNEEGEIKNIGEAMYYVSPDVSSLEFLEKKAEKDEAKARKILHITDSNDNIKGNNDMTATYVFYDSKAMYSFIKPIADQLFMLYEFCLKAIGDMRYGVQDEPRFTMIYPKSFDLETEATLLAKLKDAIDSGMPPFVARQIIIAYISSVFGNNTKKSALYRLITSTDRLLPFSNEEIAKKEAMNSAAKWEVVLHDSAINLIAELMIEDEKFLTIDFEQQREKLIEKAKQKAAELAPTQQPSAEEIAAQALNA